jgi:hypothetical protein
VIDANLLSVSTCGTAPSESLIRCASGPEKVEAVGRGWTRSLSAHTKIQLGRGNDGSASAIGLFAGYAHTADIVDHLLGMAAGVVLGADDLASAADWPGSACVAGHLTAA